MLKKRKGEIATLLTLGLVLLGGLITLGTSLFVNNQKSNFASNSRAAVCPEVYECFSINPPVCKKKNFDLSCQYTNYADADIGKCAGLPCNRNGIGLTATPTVTPRIGTPTSRPTINPRPMPTLTPAPGSLGSACGVPLVACKSGLQCINRICVTASSLPQTQPIQFNSCIFNLAKICPTGTTKVTFSGFCGCAPDQTATTKSTKRCMDETSPLYDTPNHYLSWIEEFRDSQWRIYQTCLYPNAVCNPNTFACNSIGPTGPKKFGETCQLGSDCQSGACDTKYVSPSGEDKTLFNKACTYSLFEQGNFAKKRHTTDTQLALVAGGLITANGAPFFLPFMATTSSIAKISGLPAAANYLFLQLQQPWIQNSLAAVNIAANIYSLSDCVKNGPNGEWCNMLAAVASGNPGEYGLALGKDLSTLKTSAIQTFRLTKMPSIVKNSEVGEVPIWTNTVDPPTVNPVTIDPEPLTVRAPVVANQPPDPKNWPVGFRFDSNRGGYVVVESEIGGGGFGKVYGGTLYEPGGLSKQVALKFPNNLSRSEIVTLQSEQFLLADGQNVLPVRLRPNLAKPYGFAYNGSTELPLSENFGQGTTLSALVRKNFPRPTILSRAAFNDLLETSRILDNNSIYMRDVFANNIFVTNDGRLLLYDPYFPRPNPITGQVNTSLMRVFKEADVTKFGYDRRFLTLITGDEWLYDVPIKSEAAIYKMLQLYNGLIIVK